MPEPFDRDVVIEAIEFFERYDRLDSPPALTEARRKVYAAARWAVQATARSLWWCETHQSMFLEKQPGVDPLCLYSLLQDNYLLWDWKDCVPVAAHVVVTPAEADLPEGEQ